MDWQWMRNPATGGVQRFAAAAVPAWREAGWVPCDAPAEPNLAIGPGHPSAAPTETPADVEPPTETAKSSRRAPAESRKEQPGG